MLAPYELLSREAPENIRKRQALAILLGCLPKLNDEVLLLKTALLLAAKHRETELEPNQKLPPAVWLS